MDPNIPIAVKVPDKCSKETNFIKKSFTIFSVIILLLFLIYIFDCDINHKIQSFIGLYFSCGFVNLIIHIIGLITVVQHLSKDCI